MNNAPMDQHQLDACMMPLAAVIPYHFESLSVNLGVVSEVQSSNCLYNEMDSCETDSAEDNVGLSLIGALRHNKINFSKLKIDILKRVVPAER